MSESNLPAGVTQSMLDRQCDGDEPRCSEFVNRGLGKSGPCGSDDFQALITCTGEFNDATCGYKYAVPVRWDGDGWVTVGSADCPICGYDDNPRTGVVCTNCGNDAPEHCSDCCSIPCHCADRDDKDED